MTIKERRILKTIYVANDGTEFESEAECEEYEKANENPIEKEIEYCAYVLLIEAMTTNYAGAILDLLLPDIIDDVTASADIDFNDDDVRLAIGRVLCEKLEIEF